MGIKINLPNQPDKESLTLVGDHVVFASIRYDSDSSNPCKDDGMGVIRSLSSRHYNHIDRDEAVEILENDPDAVPLSYYEHSASVWFVQDSPAPTGVEFQWDGVRFAGVWIPDDCVRENYTGQDGLSRRDWMVKQAESACEVYTQWANGDVYGYQVTAYKARKDSDGEVYDELDDYRRDDEVFEDSCWGFYGWDSVEEEVKGAIESAVETVESGRQYFGSDAEQFEDCPGDEDE